jgi:hypothetical protein
MEPPKAFCAAVAAVASDQVKHRKPAIVSDDGLSINHARAQRQRRDGFGGKREAVGEIMAHSGSSNGRRGLADERGCGSRRV